MRFFFFMISLAVVLGTATVVYLNVLESKRPVDAVVTSRADDLQALIDKGDVVALFTLATLYRTGDGGVSRDLVKARRLFEAAARKGHGGAQVAMGRAFETGEGVRADPAQAVRWYGMAARYGNNANAQYAMGRLLDGGIGVAHDPPRARDFYAKAAAQGHPVAQYLLGIAHEQGTDSRPNLLEAYRWYLLAAEKDAEVRAVDSRYHATEAAKRIKAKLNRWQQGEAEKRASATRAGYRR